jgi:50S ribosomal protein L16 3-hydroxylase
VSRLELFRLVARDDVEAKLIVRQRGRWALRAGPLARRTLPPIKQRQWTLLVQGLDLQCDRAHEMLARFRFVPEAQLDDLMISYASDGGGVGPHLDSYDVFLLQVHGRRRWRIGRVTDPRLVTGLPVKILKHFYPEHEWLLEPGDMLYLPPQWGHDGIAEGECMTCSIGFRAPSAREVERELLLRLSDEPGADPSVLYRESQQAATPHPGAMPAALRRFAERAVARAACRPGAAAQVLGQWLTEPKPNVWFDSGRALDAPVGGVRLDRRTRMIYDRRNLYVNGETYTLAGVQGMLLRRLADDRRMNAVSLRSLGRATRALLDRWAQAGWLHEC